MQRHKLKDIIDGSSCDFVRKDGRILFMLHRDTVTLFLKQEDDVIIREALKWAKNLLYGKCLFFVDELEKRGYEINGSVLETMLMMESLFVRRMPTESHVRMQGLISRAYDIVNISPGALDGEKNAPLVCYAPVKKSVLTFLGIVERMSWTISRSLLLILETIVIKTMRQILSGNILSILPIMFYETQFVASCDEAEILPILQRIGASKVVLPGSCTDCVMLQELEQEIGMYNTKIQKKSVVFWEDAEGAVI